MTYIVHVLLDVRHDILNVGVNIQQFYFLETIYELQTMMLPCF
jgi:hypothetical protein